MHSVPSAALAAALLAVASLAGVLPAEATGQSSVSDAVTWSVQPATASGPDGRQFFDYDVQAGSVISDHIAVTNLSTQPVTFHIYAADAATDYDTARFTLIGDDKASSDVGAWTNVAGGASTCPETDTAVQKRACVEGFGISQLIEPGTSAVVPFSISVPADAAPGDHAEGIVASYDAPAIDSSGTAVSIDQRVGTRVYLRVDGAIVPKLAVAGAVVGFDGGNPFGTGSATVGFDLRNTGNTRLSANPRVALTGPFGIALGTATAARVQNILPGGRAHVEMTLKGVPRLLLLFADITVAPASSDGNASNDHLPATVHSSAVTWAFPWAWVLVLIAIGVVVAGAIWWRARSRRLLAVALHDYRAQVEQETLARVAADEKETVR